MAYSSFEQAIARKADASGLVRYVIGRIDEFTNGADVPLDFLSRADVGSFCAALGFGARRNWAALTLDEISPTDKTGARVVPEAEAAAVLAALKIMISRGLLSPKEGDAPKPTLLNDFLPAPGRFKSAKTWGHLWEFQYALAVELEHGRYRGTNTTNNHPLLTGLIVMAHLSEDTLYYARLWVMESEGELFTAELAKRPFAEIHDALALLARARTHLAARIAEKLG